MQPRLYYIHDPMCSWCWGYRPVWEKLQQELPDSLSVEYVVGGLAPDSDQTMSQQMQREIQAHWHTIQSKLGTEFNFDFWIKNTPRRATYPACRAVIAARNQGCEQAMITAIQHAYYLRAMNPSDRDVLLQLAGELFKHGLLSDAGKFAHELESARTVLELERQIALARTLTHSGFPSLIFEYDQRHQPVDIDYLDHTSSLKLVMQLLATE